MKNHRQQAAKKVDLFAERARLEAQQPQLAQNYREFLDSYGRFREMKNQFEGANQEPIRTKANYRSSR